MARKAQNKPETTVEAVEETQVIVNKEEAPSIIEPILLSDCGGALRAAREKQKLSVQDVASQLRLGVKQVDALESDRYDKLPQPYIVRGFIRNYAKLLKIDATPILEAYSTLVPNTTPQSFAVKSNANASVIGENRANFSFKLFVGLLLCFALIVWFFYYYTQVIKPNVASDLSSIGAPVTQTEPSPTTDNTEFALPAAERQADAATPVALPAQTTDSNNISPPSVAEPSQVLGDTPPPPAEPANTTATASTLSANNMPGTKPSITPAPAELPVPVEQSSNPQSASERKSAQLAIDATEETWVNITDASGKQVYSKVLASGTSEMISVSPPLSITVGNAHGTSISMNGKPLDLLAHTRDKVARLKVN
jgi:cytoskeleton protein RodZ